jgi:hypothetical protein
VFYASEFRYAPPQLGHLIEATTSQIQSLVLAPSGLKFNNPMPPPRSLVQPALAMACFKVAP